MPPSATCTSTCSGSCASRRSSSRPRSCSARSSSRSAGSWPTGSPRSCTTAGSSPGRLLGDRIGIFAAAVGAIVGALLHLAIRLIGIARTTFRPRPTLTLRVRGVREFLLLMAPKMLSHPIEPLTFLYFTSLASRFDVGSVSSVSFARNFESVPVSLIGASFAIAAFPLMSVAAANGDRATFRRVFTTNLPDDRGRHDGRRGRALLHRRDDHLDLPRRWGVRRRRHGPDRDDPRGLRARDPVREPHPPAGPGAVRHPQHDPADDRVGRRVRDDRAGRRVARPDGRPVRSAPRIRGRHGRQGRDPVRRARAPDRGHRPARPARSTRLVDLGRRRAGAAWPAGRGARCADGSAPSSCPSPSSAWRSASSMRRPRRSRARTSSTRRSSRPGRGSTRRRLPRRPSVRRRSLRARPAREPERSGRIDRALVERERRPDADAGTVRDGPLPARRLRRGVHRHLVRAGGDADLDEHHGRRGRTRRRRPSGTSSTWAARSRPPRTAPSSPRAGRPG